MRRMLVLLGTLAFFSNCSGGGGGTPPSPDFSDPAMDLPDVPVILPDAIWIDPGHDPGTLDKGASDPYAPDPGQVCPGGPYCPCQKNEDCFSGYCIPSPEGLICGEPCVDHCPEAFLCRNVSAGEPIYLCVPAQPMLCVPCDEDTDCKAGFIGGGTASCLKYGDEIGSFCGGECSEEIPCPPGFTCTDVQGSRQCRADAGVCTCPKNAFHMRTTCVISNDNGTCSGIRECGEAGLTECSAQVPASETCNAKDDDCDGKTDEDLGTIECGIGPCKHTVPACIDGKENVCDPLQGRQPEACNGMDDDCDGQTDEGFPDTDGDGEADCVDPDDDNDGVPDDGNGSGSTTDKPCLPGQKVGCDDNCPFVANPGQADLDLDGKGDVCDADADGDGHAALTVGGDDCDDTDAAVNPGNVEGETSGPKLCDGRDNDCDGLTDEGYGDADQDGKADCIDPDDDNDGVPDDKDNCPKVPNPDQKDTDQNGIGDACSNDPDGDGWPNALDNCPDTVNPDQVDTDKDGKGNACDDDDDGDGDPDATDCAPLDKSVAHGVQEACNGADDNCDGVKDEGFADSDQDGLADCVDIDDDDDGILDTGDNCPAVPNTDQADMDNDKIGDACDPDMDGDGVQNLNDNCMKLANPDQLDTDKDGKGDACDDDDDDDGLADSQDNCPKIANPKQEDFDKDGMGDVCDPDEDGDGVPNDQDTCPFHDDKVGDEDDKDGIPYACEIEFAGWVWPVDGSAGVKGSEFVVYIQLYKWGSTNFEGPAKDIVVKVRYKLEGDAAWQVGTASYNADITFKDEKGWEVHNEEHKFAIPAEFTKKGGKLVVEFDPIDLTGGPGHEHIYNNGPIWDQGFKFGNKKAQPFTYPLQ